MARKIIWSDDAIQDLASLVGWIAQDSRAAAEMVGRAILARTRTLKEFPLAGRVVPENGQDTVREIIHLSYRIIYEVPDDTTVVVLRIWHASRGKPML